MMKTKNESMMFVNKGSLDGLSVVKTKQLGLLAAVLLAGLSSAEAMAATYPMTTPANDDGGGNAVFLDRHHITCGNDAINRLHLYRPTLTQIAYEYGCTQLSNTTSTAKYTGSNDDGGGNVVYLDRHVINCEHKPVQYMHLQRPTYNTIEYHYQCSDKTLSNVTDYFTPTNEDGGGNAVFLDRHDVVCPNNEVLSYLRLERPTSNTMRYHYKCGTVINEPVLGFTGDFAVANWSITGVANANMSDSTLSASVSTGGGGVNAKITALRSGKINFNWNMAVYRAGQYGDAIGYSINGVSHTLSGAGSASGSAQDISVNAGDVVELFTWGTTKSSSYFAVFDNFSFVAAN